MSVSQRHGYAFPVAHPACRRPCGRSCRDGRSIENADHEVAISFSSATSRANPSFLHRCVPTRRRCACPCGALRGCEYAPASPRSRPETTSWSAAWNRARPTRWCHQRLASAIRERSFPLQEVRAWRLSSQFSVLSSQFSVLSSQFSVLSSQFSVLSSQFSVLSSQFSQAQALIRCCQAEFGRWRLNPECRMLRDTPALRGQHSAVVTTGDWRLLSGILTCTYPDPLKSQSFFRMAKTRGEACVRTREAAYFRVRSQL